MEAVLDLYAQPVDPDCPLVCFDEKPYQIVSETRLPIPCQPGQPAREDYEYKREGTCNIFMNVAPHLGWRQVEVSEHRCKPDFALQMRALVDEHFASAHKIRVVLDNLNTHTPGALYEAFGAPEAHRILQKLEFHYTPKHGSWLNMAEIELAVLSGQCLDRRFANQLRVGQAIRCWQEQRNRAQTKIQWRFTTKEAREKLKRLYPS